MKQTVQRRSSEIREPSVESQSNGVLRSVDGHMKPMPIKRYYVDELGFYRHLDLDQRQYVCSNIDAANLSSANSKLSNGADSGYEYHFKTVRHELGISHFDRTVGYERWKLDWDKFMRNKLTRQEPVTLNRELKSRIRAGIPHDYRCKVWTALIRMRTRHLRQQVGEDIYARIIKDYVSQIEVPDYTSYNTNSSARPGSSKVAHPSESSSSSSSLGSLSYANYGGTPFELNIDIHEPALDKCFRQIELDLLRTLPNNRHFENPNSRGIQRVRRILRAFACFNPVVGYCQGMNRLAAMALLVLPEEEAFWCLVAIIHCIMPEDYYLKPWLAQVDCYVLNDLLEKKLPRLHKHLMKNDIQLTLFTWFFTIFVDGFRPELMLRIWDCFLLEGDKVLFRFALSILHISQEDLLEMNDFSTMSSHLSRIVSTRQLDMEHLFDSK